MYLNLFTPKNNNSIINLNSFLITTNSGYQKKAKSIATYDFSTLNITLPHYKLIKRLCNVSDFVFEGGNRTHICIFKKKCCILGKIVQRQHSFQQKYIKYSFKTSYTKLLFMVGNSLLKQKIGISMGIDPTPFSAKIFLYS